MPVLPGHDACNACGRRVRCMISPAASWFCAGVSKWRVPIWWMCLLTTSMAYFMVINDSAWRILLGFLVFYISWASHRCVYEDSMERSECIERLTGLKVCAYARIEELGDIVAELKSTNAAQLEKIDKSSAKLAEVDAVRAGVAAKHEAERVGVAAKHEAEMTKHEAEMTALVGVYAV